MVCSTKTIKDYLVIQHNCIQSKIAPMVWMNSPYIVGQKLAYFDMINFYTVNQKNSKKKQDGDYELHDVNLEIDKLGFRISRCNG